MQLSSATSTKTGAGAHQRHHAGGRGKGETGHEDCIARPDPLGHQRYQQRIGAARAGDRVGGTGTRGERRLELGHRRPQDEAAILQDTGDGGVDIGLEAPVLRAEVDEWDEVEVGVLVGR